MRILHTADWHLGDRLGRVDRSEDIQRGVDRIAEYCRTERVDVLLVAGDLFSELARPDSLRDAIRHLQETFAPFLHGGGTILAITGNHDNENFCQTLWHAMNLAAPAAQAGGAPAASGRVYLATTPSLLRLPDRKADFNVQFLLMPYPTPSRYFDDEAMARYGSLDEKNRRLIEVFSKKLRGLRSSTYFDRRCPSVLAAHLSVTGAAISSLFRMSEPEDLVLEREELGGDFAYVALGHIHKPQAVGGCVNMRYSGSIERLDLGEQGDVKSVVLVEIGSNGLAGEPALLPMPATPIYEIDIHSPAEQMPTLAKRYEGAANDLVNLHVAYTAGVDNLEELLHELEEIFPRWYARDWREKGALGPTLTIGAAPRGRSFEDTVRDYLNTELTNFSEQERAALLERAEKLMQDLAT